MHVPCTLAGKSELCMKVLWQCHSEANVLPLTVCPMIKDGVWLLST